jgi:hypothetical protein
MRYTRRRFLRHSTFAAPALLAAASSARSSAPLDLKPYLTGERMAPTPATAYRAYRSKPVTDPTLYTWVQVDLGSSLPIDAVVLYPASERLYPGRDEYYGGEGFPLRFRVDASDAAAFAQSRSIGDFTAQDFPDPGDQITRYAAPAGLRARYVRLTATLLRPVRTASQASAPANRADFTLTLAKFAVLSSGRDAAVLCPVTADPSHGNPELLAQLTRRPRLDGEAIRIDHPALVANPARWRRPPLAAHPPRSGVTLAGGLFEQAMRRNIEYLLTSFSTDDLLRQFYERTGHIKDFKPTGSQVFWEEDLAGSNAGRFLMGAANTIRWIDHPELRARVTAVVDGIADCRRDDGYMMAYPPESIFYSERAAYTRAWLTHGLLEAGYSGNPKALPMLRGYYDWFNRQDFLPLMERGATQGGQGMIANTRVALSPVGRPADAQVIQRYYQEEAFLAGLARHEPEQIWQYPYDRPHCYLLTNLEAYLDLYLLTGDRRYYDAVLGGWELYRAHWEQAGGSISIIEFERNPPDSNYLRQKLGELCGSAFWVFLSQRFQMLHPEDERFAAEIEKSIYNIGIANQDGTLGLRYHTILEGRKEKGSRVNTCCEGQGTRLLGSLPEHIYSLAADGLYLHLYEPSTIRWHQDGAALALTVATRFPFDTAVTATFQTASPVRSRIRVRVPLWAAGPFELRVNGTPAGSGAPSSYVTLDRVWSDGDRIEFTLAPALLARRYTGADQLPGKARFSVEYGPILLAAIGASKVDLQLEPGAAPESLARLLEPVPGSPLHFHVRGNPAARLMPYWQIETEEFTCYPAVVLRA